MTAYAAPSVEAGTAAATWRATDLVHALAQLPATVSLELHGPDTERLALVARAYGLEHRLELHAAHDTRWQFTGAAAAAPEAATLGALIESMWPPDLETALPEGDDTVLAGHRIALVTNIPTHYRVPLFNGLARKAGRAGAALRVFFMGAPPPAQPWLASAEGTSFEHEYVPSAQLPQWVPLSSDVDRVRPPRLPLALGRRLRAFGPSIVVAGSFSFSGMAAAAYAARHRVPFGLWNGDVAHQLHNRSYAALRARQRRRLAGRAAFGIAYGWHAVRYLGDLAPQLPAVIARNTSVTAVAPEHDAGGNSGRELLAVADLSVPEKGFETIAAALRLLDDPAYRLRVIGNPPADAAAHDPRIEFLGPLPHDQVRAAFARSDIFLFPSRMDIFGLALPEAMAAGRPAITSGVPGAVGDLAVPGANCVLVPARDPRAWAAAIDVLAGDPGRRAALGAAAQATVRRRWTMAHAVEATMAGLRLGALCAGEAA